MTPMGPYGSVSYKRGGSVPFIIPDPTDDIPGVTYDRKKKSELDPSQQYSLDYFRDAFNDALSQIPGLYTLLLLLPGTSNRYI